MGQLNDILKEARLKTAKVLKTVAKEVQMDYSLLSRIENGSRMPTKAQLLQLAEYYDIRPKELLLHWLSDKIYLQLKDEAFGLKALQLAKSRLSYTVKAFNNQSLLKKVDQLKQRLDQQRPLEKAHLQKLMDYFKVEYTFDSNRMEGNTLSLKETALVIEKGMTIPGKSVHEHFETVNHAEAVDLLYEFIENKSELNDHLLKHIHALILRGIDKHHAGVYRSVNVRISSSKYEPPKPFMLNKLMEDYFLFYQEQKGKMHPLVLAAEMHERLVTIHPFVDGNGRTARLVMNLVLMQAGYPITNISSEQENRLTYYESLELAQTENNKNPFIEFVGQHLVKALEGFLRMAA